jgi:hypothetical protein
MTLLISVHGPSFVMLVGDQRLSAAGTAVSEHGNKLMAIAATDARLALGYTGLAYTAAHEFVTQDWLRMAVCRAGDRDPTYLGLTSGVAAQLAHEFVTNDSILRTALPDRRLTIAIAGYVNRAGISTGCLSIISNFQDFDARIDYANPWSEFRVKRLIEQTPGAPSDVMVQRFGAWPALREVCAMRIEDAVRAGKSAKTVATIAAGFIPKAADEAEGQSIGRQTNAVIIERSLEHVETWFSSGSPTDSPVLPDLAHLRPGFRASKWVRFDVLERVKEHLDERSAWIPTVGRRKPCPCGAGKQFRHCHGKHLKSRRRSATSVTKQSGDVGD